MKEKDDRLDDAHEGPADGVRRLQLLASSDASGAHLVVDVENGAVDGVFVGETNPLLVEGGRAVSVPYRWIQSVGDIVILRYFPKRVSLKKAAPAVPAAVSER